MWKTTVPNILQPHQKEPYRLLSILKEEGARFVHYSKSKSRSHAANRDKGISVHILEIK